MLAMNTEATELKHITDDPVFAAANSETSRLRALADERASELREVERRIAEVVARGTDEPSHERVAAILNNEPLPPIDDLDSLRSRAALLRRERAEFRAAMMIHKNALGEMRAAASGPAADSLRGAHKCAVRRILASLAELRNAIAEEHELHQQLAEAGFDDLLADFHPPVDLDPVRAWTLGAWERGAKVYAQ